MKKRKQQRRRLLALTLVLILVLGAAAIYLGDYYPADADAIAAFTADSAVVRETLSDGTLVFRPESPQAGLIFYPGGKVDHTAYVPLMDACAQRGFLCVLVEMPFRLAVLDSNAADPIPALFPEISTWYVGGHSLGGAMAATWAEKNPELCQGLILLGAYSSCDLSDLDLRVLSVYGSEDQVMNREKYDSYIVNLPADYRESVIDGGCHAYFGMYGPQDGDGVPTISPEEQLLITAEQIALLLPAA